MDPTPPPPSPLIALLAAAGTLFTYLATVVVRGLLRPREEDRPRFATRAELQAILDENKTLREELREIRRELRQEIRDQLEEHREEDRRRLTRQREDTKP